MRQIGIFIVAIVCCAFSSSVHGSLLYKGMSYMSFGNPADFNTPESDQSLISLQQIGANTVALNVWWFQDTPSSTNIAPDYNRYSSTIASVQHAIDVIHGLGMNVLLKPLVDLQSGDWRGDIKPGNVNAWFASYSNFINQFADLAQQNRNNGVKMLSVGCELNNTEQYDAQWTSLISGVRSRYSGALTYSANWTGNVLNQGGFANINWWNQLDYIGIDAYFPLTHLNSPTEAQLQASWTDLANQIAFWRYYSGLNQPVLFTEAGYQSIVGTNRYSKINLSNLQQQADCYQALLTVMQQQTWFDGVFWWNWLDQPSATDFSTGFTPQGKQATLDVLKQFYGAPVPEPALLGTVLFGCLAILRHRPRRCCSDI